MLKTKQHARFLILIFNSAFIGMLAQFLLGYTSGILTGALYKQYALIMGLFVFFMALGAHLFGQSQRPLRDFVLTQTLGPLLVATGLWLTATRLTSPPEDWYFLVQLVLIAAIGLLAGGELPLLVSLIPQRSDQKSRYDQILYFDYLAMAIAAGLFGSVMLQNLGVTGVFSLILTGHLFALSLVLFSPRGKAPAS